jgi:hypothetical protein
MTQVVTAILGGAVGVLLSALARALGIPSEARAHDAAIADRDAALATWVADRNYTLRRECEPIRRNVPPNPTGDAALPDGGGGHDPVKARAYLAQKADVAIADAKGRALHEYRDEGRRARLDVATILAAEGFGHRLYRRLTHRTPPTLTTPDRAAPVLDAWRKPSAMDPERLTFPDDATKRTLEDEIANMPVTGP